MNAARLRPEIGAVRSLVAGVWIGLSLFAGAAAAEEAAPAKALDPARLQALEKEWRSCPEGYYTGPRPGRRNYSNDKYLWVVTPEFAKRFCMPEHLVSAELKGAEAVAFKMVGREDGNDGCGVDRDGTVHCTENSWTRFEIFLPQSLNLPAAHPEVKFFDNERNNAGWHLSSQKNSERWSRSIRYEQGTYQVPPGKTPHFGNPFHHPDRGYGFSLMYAHEGTAKQMVGGLWEVGFQADWSAGLDLLVLEAPMAGGFRWAAEGARKVDGFDLDEGNLTILMDSPRMDSARKVPESSLRGKPLQDFHHAIHLPAAFALQVRAAASAPGSTWEDFLKATRQR